MYIIAHYQNCSIVIHITEYANYAQEMFNRYKAEGMSVSLQNPEGKMFFWNQKLNFESSVD